MPPISKPAGKQNRAEAKKPAPAPAKAAPTKAVVKVEAPRAPKLQSQLTAEQEQMALAVEEALISGNVGDLPVEKRAHYVAMLCSSLSLNKLTKPFIYIKDDSGKMMLYATRDCSEQLRKRDGIITKVKERKTETINGCPIHIVTVTATNKEGREDESIGAVSLFGYDGRTSYPLVGDRLANALMKAETKGKRRVTLSIAGLGIPDETEAGFQSEPLRGEVVEPLTAEERVRMAGAHALQGATQRLEAGTGDDGSGAAPEEPTAPAGSEGAGTAEHIEPSDNDGGEVIGNDKAEVGSMEWHGVTEDNYEDIIVHAGQVGGKVRDKRVGDLPLPLIDLLMQSWYPHANAESQQDTQLAVAIHLRRKALTGSTDIEPDPKAAAPATPVVEPGPFGDDETRPLNAEERSVLNEMRTGGASKPAATPAPKSAIDWRKVGIPVECAIKGQALGSQDDPHLRSLHRQIVPRIKNPGLLEQQFIDALKEAIWERGLDGESKDFGYVGEDELLRRLGEEIDNLALTQEQGEEYLREVKVLQKGEHLNTVGAEMLLYIWQNIASIKVSIRQALAPSKPSAPKGGKK